MFIVLEGPDMTFYGDAVIHGVYATREEAEDRAQKLGWTRENDSWSNYGIEEWRIGESSE